MVGCRKKKHTPDAGFANIPKCTARRSGHGICASIHHCVRHRREIKGGNGDGQGALEHDETKQKLERCARASANNQPPFGRSVFGGCRACVLERVSKEENKGRRVFFFLFPICGVSDEPWEARVPRLPTRRLPQARNRQPAKEVFVWFRGEERKGWCGGWQKRW